MENKLANAFITMIILALGLFMGVAINHLNKNDIIESQKIEVDMQIQEYCNLQEIAKSKINGENHIIYYDKNTRVMYYRIDINSGGVFTILNADGTPKLYEGELKNG